MNGEPSRWLAKHAEHESEECLIWPFSRDNNGRAKVFLGKKCEHVARLICEQKRGPAPSHKHEAAHECGNGHLGCVNPNHLQWKTHKENMADMVSHGRSQRGEKHYCAKLTVDEVRLIRDDVTTPARILAHRYGMSRNQIYQIRTNQRWQGVSQ